MFGIYRAVFRNPKWAALWAGGVLLTAYCTVPQDGEDPAAALMPAQAERAAEQPTEQGAEPAPPPEPVDPWALEK